MSAEIIPEAEQAPRFIVPLFDDTWTPEHAEGIRDIGATTILLCPTERDIVERHRTRQIEETAAASHELGLEVWTDLWGVAGLFGGEAPTSVAQKDQYPASPQVRRLISDGLDLAAGIGSSHMFWDEVGSRYDQLTFGQEVDFIEKLASRAAVEGLKSVVCLQASYKKESIRKLDIVAAHDDVEGVGISAYYDNYPGDNDDPPEKYIGGFARPLKAIENSHGVQAHMWAQGFHLPYPPFYKAPMDVLEVEFHKRDWYSVPLMQVSAAAAGGVLSYGYWASQNWEAACTAGLKTPAYKERVWQLGAEIVKFQQKEAGRPA